MKKLCHFISLFLLLPGLVMAQESIQAIVSPTNIVAGESFRVQFVISNASKIEYFSPPDFQSFKLVSGPDIYPSVNSSGNLNPKIPVNYIYTLLAVKPGIYNLSSARAMVNGKLVRSGKQIIRVFSKVEASRNSESDRTNSAYFLNPGEDVNEKIRKNLFMKLLVDKKSCYIGEPVLATYKLYSRLESRSDIIKNPGFYGFTVLDMISLNDKFVTTETIDGKNFDVHTIRKVQLYPLRAGRFIIDPMEISNKVEFSRSSVYKKTEQVIVEGMHTEEKNNADNNKTVIENEIRTEPVSIDVKPVPAVNKPEIFNGATGQFEITASLVQNNLAINEEGFLEIAIKGSGNFIQLSAPSVQWPQGLEGFEPVVKDSLDKLICPLTGKRIFRYPFVSGKKGDYTIPPVKFSFFNPQTVGYSIVATEPQQVQITNEIKNETLPEVITNDNPKKSYFVYWILGALAIGFAILLLLIKKGNTSNRKQIVIEKEEQPQHQSVETILSPAHLQLPGDENLFYRTLYENTWKYFTDRFGLVGSSINKNELVRFLQQKEISNDLIKRTREVLEASEAAMFTHAKLPGSKEIIYRETVAVLKEIDEKLF
ncbi:MAG TPA: BatD family protein [Chitinophagaceae bacterium]|nr:BatD family protein [Chitinophagaceae bacterium]